MPGVPSFNKSDDAEPNVKYKTHVEYTWAGPDGKELVGVTAFNESQHTYRLSYNVTTKEVSTQDINTVPKAPFGLHTHLVHELVTALNKNLPAAS